MMGRSFTICLVVLGLVRGAAGKAADWPTWRCDAGRTAATSAELPESMHLVWNREFARPLTAWPNEPRLQFDAAYEPIVTGKRLVMGSPEEGSVTAFDTETGAQQWKYFTEGPVRFAPVAWKDRLFVGSDDGCVYCLATGDGSLRWKIRVAPADRPDLRHLGNARIISFWPVRGGPVLAEGVLYCAAGLWPTQGVFVVALDAASGKLVWRNDALGFLEKVRLSKAAGIASF